MALTKNDIAQIKLANMELMQEHREKDHKPIEAEHGVLHGRINRLKWRIVFWSGGLAAFGFVIALVVR